MYNCCVKVNSTTTLRRRRYGGLMVGVMDPYWGSLHCVCTLTWYWSRNRGDKGAAEVTSIAALLNSFLHFFPVHWNQPKLLSRGLVSHTFVSLYIGVFGYYILS